MNNILLVPSRLLAHAEAALIGCHNPVELPKKAIRYVAALQRFFAAQAHVNRLEQDDLAASAADVLGIAVEKMSTDELDTAAQLFAQRLNETDMETLRKLLETARARAAEAIAAVAAPPPPPAAPVDPQPSQLEHKLQEPTKKSKAKRSAKTKKK